MRKSPLNLENLVESCTREEFVKIATEGYPDLLLNGERCQPGRMNTIINSPEFGDTVGFVRFPREREIFVFVSEETLARIEDRPINPLPYLKA